MNTVSKIIANRGLSRLAADLGVSYQAVRKWERGGVPPDRVLALARVTGWRVTPHQIREDIYPHPEDGLPADLRGRDQAA